MFTFPKYVSFCGCSKGSPYISEVDARRSLALCFCARSSMFFVPIEPVSRVSFGICR